jgi:alkaline phosphatase D
MVLWTRLAPDPLNGGGMSNEVVEVSWFVAADEGFRKPVQQGVALAVPELAHSVHVDVRGLEPDRWYWYRFVVGSEVSVVGRTRTLPEPGSQPHRLRFGVASCQYYEAGLYTAYGHLAAEDLDFVLHLGDYIYEGGPLDGGVRQHLGGETFTLDDYRRRYAQYKTDPLLQHAHAQFPWYVTWDDHEVDNNYASDISQNADPRDVFLARRAAAYQAYYEHLPLRASAKPVGPEARLYRDFRFGTLATVQVLDTRQYRTDQPCNDGAKPLCPEALDPHATMLGFEQEQWLARHLAGTTARWSVIAQQVIVANIQVPWNGELVSFMDSWSGYDAARNRLLHTMKTAAASNYVVLTGDAHAHWVFDLTEDTKDVNAPVVATEFVGTSISSGGDGSPTTEVGDLVLEYNPFAKYHNFQRGYVRCEVEPNLWRSDMRVVDFVRAPGAPISSAASFVIEAGRPGAQPG